MCFGQAITRDLIVATVASLALAHDSLFHRPEAFKFIVKVFVFTAFDIIEDTKGDSGFLYVGISVGFCLRIALNVSLNRYVYDRAIGFGCGERKGADCSSESG